MLPLVATRNVGAFVWVHFSMHLVGGPTRWARSVTMSRCEKNLLAHRHGKRRQQIEQGTCRCVRVLSLLLSSFCKVKLVDSYPLWNAYGDLQETLDRWQSFLPLWRFGVRGNFWSVVPRVKWRNEFWRNENDAMKMTQSNWRNQNDAIKMTQWILTQFWRNEFWRNEFWRNGLKQWRKSIIDTEKWRNVWPHVIVSRSTRFWIWSDDRRNRHSCLVLWGDVCLWITVNTKRPTMKMPQQIRSCRFWWFVA